MPFFYGGKMLSERINFNEKIKINIAFHLRESYQYVDEIAKKIHIVSETSFREMASSVRLKGNVLMSSDNQYYIVRDTEKDIYYTAYAEAESDLLIYIISRIQGLSNSEAKRSGEIFANNRTRYNIIQSWVEEIISIQKNIAVKYGEMQDYKPFDYKELHKYCKKYRIKFTLNESNGEFDMEFNKVCIGNEAEGYINYKKIILTFNSDFNLLNVKYYFNDWYYDREWREWFGFSRTLHPHISGSICYGNRTGDMENYINNKNYAFIVDLINTSVRSYYPENPFISITDISKILLFMKYALPKSGKTSKEFFNTQSVGETLCTRCNSYMYLGECSNPQCNTQINTQTQGA
jgi:hypothetical protein